MTPANDNQPRSPEQHRRILAEQATTGERAYQGGSWPQGRRLHKAGKLVRVDMGMGCGGVALGGWPRRSATVAGC